jgi:hypothetical protein
MSRHNGKVFARCAGLVALGFLAVPLPLDGQERTQQPDTMELRERQVRRQRAGAGIRLGSWQVTGLAEVDGATYSTMPAFEGYWQRGLDRHLVIESGFGLWRRSQKTTGTTSEDIGSYVIPLLTSVKLYPTTGPEVSLEPFVSAGAGFTIGIDDRNTTTGGLLGGGVSGGTVIIAGVGLKGEAGVEYRFSRAFGLSLTGGYQWVRFFEEVGGERTYKGFVVFGGMTYRFQY